MNEKDDEEKVITAWHTAFKKGTDFDLWGQPLEAIDGYQRLIARNCSSKFLVLHFCTHT